MARIHLPTSRQCPIGTPLFSPPASLVLSDPHPFTPLHSAELFPAGEPPPLRPNSDPRCNRPPYSPVTLPHVVTSLRRDAWEFHLQDYPDRSFVDTLLHIIDHGALLGFDAPDHAPDCKNLISCSINPEAVSSAIAKLTANSYARGPYLSPPLQNFRSSPLGLATRKRSSKLRLINHLSWPHGTSVNDGIPDSEAHIHYDSFESALKVIRAYGPGTLLAKLDLKDAFHHIPVAPSQWHLLGFHWQSQFYYSIVLTFGLRSAPYIFNLFAEGLHWIIRRHIPGELCHYLDDFLPIFHPNTPLPIANAAVAWCQSLGKRLGLNFQDEKTVLPCTQLEYLGLEIDTMSMEARLPPEKLEYLREILASALLASTMTLRKLQGLVGFLQFASQVIPHSRAFIRRLIDFSMTFPSPFSCRRIPAYARAYIQWWHHFVASWNGVRLLSPSYPTIHIYTDASGTKGIGGIFDDRWFSSRVPRRFRHRDIQFKEIYAVLQAILRWGHLWRHHHIVFHIDNKAIVAILAKETTRVRFTMSITRQIVMLAAILEFSFSSSWLPSAMNTLADAASRFKYMRLLHLAPSLSRQSCKIYPPLAGTRSMLISRPRSLSFCGMDSPPPPAEPTAQGSDHSLTFSPCTPTCSTVTAPFSQPTKLPSLSGSRTWDSQSVSSPQQSRPTWDMSSPFTSILTYRSMPSNPLLYSESLGVSSVILATGTEGQLRPSPSASSNVSSQSQLHMPHSSTLTLTQQSSLPLRVSCAPENSQSKGTNIKPLTPLLTSPGAPYPSSHPLMTLPASVSPSRPPKQTLSGRALPLTSRQWRPPPAQSRPFGSFSPLTPGPRAPHYSAMPMAPPCCTPPSSQTSGVCCL